MIEDSDNESGLIGPYVRAYEIGRGGMARVYAAHRRAHGEMVALKVLEVSRVSALVKFRHEIRLLGRLKHPGVIPLLESSTHRDPPWYAMPLVEGQTLAELIGRGPSYVSEPLRRVIKSHASASTVRDTRLARVLSNHTTRSGGGGAGSMHERLRGLSFGLVEPMNWGDVEGSGLAPEERGVFELGAVRGALEHVSLVCQTLAYLHGEGVVHRDIKPTNIVLTESGHPVLLDFGLATEFGARTHASQLDAVGLRDGTVRYVSPEQIHGELVDARADLYAIGCILYQIVTGVTPFEHEDPATTLLRHVGVTPRPLEHFVLGVPEELSELVTSLLAKDPVDRPGDANAVVESLSRLISNVRWEHAPEPRPYLFMSRFVGRERVIERARAGLLCAERQLGAAIEVVGEGGVGKTRLAAEIVRIARMRSAVVVSGRGVNVDSSGATRASGAPLHLFHEALTRIADELRVAASAPLAREHIMTLARYSPALLRATAQEMDASHSVSEQAIFEALEQGLDWLCGEAVLLLVLDDMQWADELSWSAAKYLSERAGQKRWMILALSRPSERVGSALAQRYELGPISSEDVRGMVEQVLGARSVPRSLVEHVNAQSGGVPLVVSECLRLLVDCGVLQRTRHGAWMLDIDAGQLEQVASEHAGPSSMIRARLTALGEPSWSLAAVGALLGRSFASSLLVGVLDESLEPDTLSERLGVLADAGVLIERDQDLIFCHDLVRQAAYELLDLSARGRLHARAAALIQESGSPDWLEVAYHWVCAGDRHRASLAYLDAGRAYVERAAYLDAQRAFDTAKLISSERALGLRAEFEGMWLAHQRRGLFAEVAPLLDDLYERIVTDCDIELELELIAARAESARQLEQVELALALVARGTERARAHGDIGAHRPIAKLKVIEANCYFLRGELDRALDVYDVARRLFEQLGDRMGEGIVLSNTGNIRRRRGEFAQAVSCYERALSLFVAIPSRRMKYVVLGNLGNARRDLGDLTGAIQALEECVEAHRVDHNRRTLALVSTNLGRLYLETGALSDADELLSWSLETSRALGIERRVGAALLYCGLLARRRLEFEVAEACLRESIECFDECDEVYSMWTSRLSLLEFLCERGRFDEYRALRERWGGELGQLDDATFLTGQLAELAGQCALYEERVEVARREFDLAASVYAGLSADVRWLVALAWGAHARLAGGDVGAHEHVELVYEVAAGLPEIAGESAAALARLERALQARELHVGLAREDHPMGQGRA